MRFRVPFKKFRNGVLEDNPYALCWPCLTIGWLYVRFTWELVVHTVHALPMQITEEALEDAKNWYGGE